MSQLEYRKAYDLDDIINEIMGGYTLDNFFCVYKRI